MISGPPRQARQARFYSDWLLPYCVQGHKHRGDRCDRGRTQSSRYLNPITTKRGRFCPPSQRSQVTFSRGYVPGVPKGMNDWLYLLITRTNGICYQIVKFFGCFGMKYEKVHLSLVHLVHGVSRYRFSGTYSFPGYIWSFFDRNCVLVVVCVKVIHLTYSKS